MSEPGVIINGNNAIPVAYKPGVFTITKAEEPLFYFGAGHDFWVLKDPFGQEVAEINGLPTLNNGQVEPFGYSGNGKLIVHEAISTTRYKPEDVNAARFLRVDPAHTGVLARPS